MNLTVRVGLSRISGYRVEAPWLLRITDETSGATVLEARLSDDEYARIHATQEVTLDVPVDLNTSGVLGKKHEVMHLDLDRIEPSMTPEAMRAVALAALGLADRVAGWEPSPFECKHYNHHRRNRDGTYRMAYGRFVDPPPALSPQDQAAVDRLHKATGAFQELLGTKETTPE